MNLRAISLALLSSSGLVACHVDRDATCMEFGLVYDEETETCVCPVATTWTPFDGGAYRCVPDDAGVARSDGGGPTDAGMRWDDAEVDGGVDAGPPCGDCADSDPCTIDTCSPGGVCEHAMSSECVIEVLAAGPSHITEIGGHSCVRQVDGRVRCWGNNRHGQLGIGSTVETHLDAMLAVGLPDATALGSGLWHTCALRTSGLLACWGRGDYGQLGNGAMTGATTPSSVPGVGSVISVAGGTAHTCAAEESGRVWCWGANSAGQVGDGTSMNTRPSRTLVVGVAGSAVEVAAGDQHSCARLATGRVQCWGFNNEGQLGDGSMTTSATPVLVSGLTDAARIAVGQAWSCALRASGEVACWGQAHPRTTTPRLVSGLPPASALAVGRGHACAIVADSSVWCWGWNDQGQLGDGTTSAVPRATPVRVVDISDAIGISAGGLHSCALLRSRDVMCWGYNGDGQLGTRTTVPSLRPVRATVLDR